MASSPEIPSHRACAHCRSQKVRCIPDDSNPDVCQRCARSGRPCVFTPLQKRKQRKRTDTRVAELEREMRAMRTALKQKEEAAGARSASPGQEDSPKPIGLWYDDSGPEAERLESLTWPGKDEDSTETGHLSITGAANEPSNGPFLWPRGFSKRPAQDIQDIVDSGKISMPKAHQLFESYRTELFPHYPMVPISPSTTAEEMRRTKPILFLAVIAAAAGKENAELSAALDQEVLHKYATHSLMQSEKSLELVQALLISSVWYHPPKKFGQLKYYEYIHMAATMAMDLGIGSRPTKHRSQRQTPAPARIHPAEDVRNPDLSMAPRFGSTFDTGSLECRRTFLTCYFICAGVSMSLRRPNMLRVSSYIRECVDYLDQSPDAIPTDRTLVVWAKLVMIGEEISTAFCFDDPGGIASICDLRTQMMLKEYEKRLSAWYRSVPEVDLGSGALPIMYYTVRLYLHEIALHVDHSPEDFRAPYQMGVVHPYPDSEPEVPTQVLAESIAESISSSHALLNVFLGMDVEILRGIPVFTFVRVSFAAFVLAKLCLSASTPGSRIGSVLDRSSLKVESYMDKLILHVRNIVGPHKCRVPAIFLALLFKLRQWCLHPEIIVDADREIPAIGPSSRSGNGKRVTLDIEGPRFIEQTSSADSSPRTISGTSQTSQQDAYHGASTSAPSNGRNGSTGLTPVAEEDSLYQYNTLGSVPPMNPGNHVGLPTSTASLPQNGEYNMPAFDAMPMELDNSYYQMLTGMDAFTEGGLTGLDDWATQPTDLLAQINMMNWQQSANMNNATGSM